MTIIYDYYENILHEFFCNEIDEDEIASFMEKNYPMLSKDDYYYIRTKNDY